MSPPPEQEPGPKRTKQLACKRCRHRKQKCTEVRPCENCTQSGSECIPSLAAIAKPPLEPDYVQRLEERVAQLESLIPQESLDHINATQSDAQIIPDSRMEIQPSFNTAHDYQIHENQDASPVQYETTSFTAPMAWEHTPPDIGGANLFGTLSGIYNHPCHDDAISEYPLLLKHEFLQWADSWRTSRDALSSTTQWKGFFVYMVYAIAFLMTKTRINGAMRSQTLYSLATSKYLPYVVGSPDPILRAQAFLLLNVYALHMPSRENIISLSTWTVRFCVMAQFHLAETEPKPLNSEALIRIQHRRRIFWCAYAIDRAVCSTYDLPFSIPDHQITTPIFANIDDEQLLAAASPGLSLPRLVESTSPTSVSAALHVLVSRQIESEIQERALSRNFVPNSEEAFDWRSTMVEKLKSWNRQTEALLVPSQKGYVSPDWLRMIYYYNIAMLYRPTKTLARGIAGDWSVQACCQALLLFRKFQMAREIAQPWLGLLTQFQIGVTLLYCFYATPISQWKPSYKSANVPDAIRACSSTLAILAERWAEAECVRDIFEILAREIPLGETWDRPIRMSETASADIEENWHKMATIVIHRPTLRMIHEMATEEFVVDRLGENTDGTAQHAAASATSLIHGIDLQWNAPPDRGSVGTGGGFGSRPSIETMSDHQIYFQ